MELLKIEKVVGNEIKSPSAEIKPNPVVAPKYCHHEGLQCFHCLIIFKDLKSKERHIRRNHRDEYAHHLQQNNTLFMCYKCNKPFSTAEELSQHQRTHITDEKPFSCSLCQKRFCTFSERNKHRRKDCGKRRYLCEDCGTRFPIPFRLRKHRIAMHPEKEVTAENADMFQCSKCGVCFQSEEELLQHLEEFSDCVLGESQGEIRRYEPVSTYPEVEVKKIKQEKDAKGYEGCSDSTGTASVKPKIPCPEEDCDCTFPSVEALRTHKKEQHGPRALKAPSSEYTRPTCGENCARESTLKAHQSSHIKREVDVERDDIEGKNIPLMSHDHVMHVAR
ncbi:PREDICTED: zinc finger protein Xfin-like [Cyprinodon variegatus]|uniref:Zinc finger protein Xfin-like n=1 Tax=Cyprinodon variegatus TaxID=28743 RepID=A0A3Q2DBD5_CYPVA|nr:PREDICTED: zinc finger protein Xfin-like [Cyprinodon variegatus]XP_015255385.1 PREDICTED: zinc finger protein Xfin-like [Cyprinodon variegatus]